MRQPRLLSLWGCLERVKVEEGQGEEELGEVVAVEKDERDEVAAVEVPLGVEEKKDEVAAAAVIQMVVVEG